MKKAIILTLGVCGLAMAHAQTRTDTSRAIKTAKPMINSGVKIAVPMQPVKNTASIPKVQQTATGMLYTAPAQGKDVRIEITGIDDNSTNTKNTYVVHYKIINGGTEDFHTGYSRVRSYLYTSAGTRIPTGGDTCVVPVQKLLTPGSSVEWKATVFSQFLYNNGSYKVTLMADARNELAEGDETNNTAAKAVTGHVPAPVAGTVTDIDGNVYRTLQIGTQVWMVENLKTTKLNDGTALVNPKQVLISNNNFGQPASAVGNGWGMDLLSGAGGSYNLRATNPAYCYYNDDAGNNATYGKLYNWYAVNSGKLAPAGWHVATDADWDLLAQYASDPVTYNVANIDKNLRSTTGWSNAVSTNITGFSALPGGGITLNSGAYKFGYLGSTAKFWSNGATPKGREIQSNVFATVTGIGSTSGFSVRCVKNMP